MADLPAFGPFLTRVDVERAAVETMRRWQREYLAWAERETGREPHTLGPVRSFVTSRDMDGWAEKQLPSLLVLANLTDAPSRNGRGVYAGRYALGIALVVPGRDRASASDHAAVYTAVFRTLLLHQRLGADLPCEGIEWVSEEAEPSPHDKRVVGIGKLVLVADVRTVANARAPMLDEPREDPYHPWPDPGLVLTTDVEVSPEEELEP
jgi:hypothetical protein